MSVLPTPLISVEELAQQIDHEELVLLDASWYMPAMQRDGFQEWQQQRIAHAQHFDFHGQICDSGSEYPHTMPSAEFFTQCVQALGVNEQSHIVVYDGLGLFASPRVWWMFKAMGHDNVSVLNGGLPAWENAGFELNTDTPKTPTLGNFIAKQQPDKFTDAESVLAQLDSTDVVIIDARNPSRYDGSEQEPRAGIRSGHIPSSKNLPFTGLVDNGFLRSENELRQQLSALGNEDQSLIFTCGSGVTACHLALAADICGYPKLSVFDGSWSEWGARHELPIAECVE